MALRRVALRYMTRFGCLGSACEDTCCQGWRVAVDQGHYVRLRRAYGGPGERERFERLVPLVPPAERDKGNFATIQMGDSGCPFLDADRLCSIHRRHGEAMLADICAQYPRIVHRVGGRVELAGELSCPEVARRALLTEDATDLVEAPAAAFGAGERDVADATDPALARHLDEVRGAMYELVSLREEPVPTRLYLAACLADQTDPLFQRQPFDQGALEAAVDHLARPATQLALASTLRRAQPSLPRGIEVIVGLLSARLQTLGRGAFLDVLRAVIASYAAEAGAGVTAGADLADAEVEPPLLAAAYGRRRDAVAAAFGELIDRCCYNYCRHYWLKELYFQSGGLRAHARALMANVAQQRFLLLSHPEAAAAAAHGDAAAFERLAVRVFYSFARSTGHNVAFAALVREQLAAQLPGLAESLCLLAV